ncbi:MAG: hypothetical protein O3C40_01585 [Planctomycetota bacterium]|nr:hypothetical protein [Planctomycetota bacterium]
MNPDIAFRAIEDSDLEFLYQVYANSREHRIMDIALLAAHRGRGIGGKIMRDLLDRKRG